MVGIRLSEQAHQEGFMQKVLGQGWESREPPSDAQLSEEM